MSKQQMVVVAAVLAFGGCGKSADKKSPDKTTKDAAAAVAPATDATAVATVVDAAVAIDAPAAATDSTAVEKRFEECWQAAWDASKHAMLKGCYTADAMVERPGGGAPARNPDAILALAAPYQAAFSDLHGEIQLVLAQGPNVAVLGLVTGTQSGKLSIDKHEVAPAKQKLGLWTGEAAFVDATGHLTHEWQFLDVDSIVAQLATPPTGRPAIATLPRPKEVVIATGAPVEAANRITVLNFLDAWSKHDRAKTGAFLADGLVWSEASLATDLDKAGALDRFAALWKGFSNATAGAMTVWAAGDYAVAIETITGVNDGDVALPDLTAKKTKKRLALPMLAIYKLDHDKVVNVWTSYTRAGLVLATVPEAPMPPPTPKAPAPKAPTK